MQKTAAAGYDADFALWSQEQAAALREGRFHDVDIENVSEEIASLGRSDKRELRNRLVTLMVHLLKLEYQPEKATPSWRGTIVEQARKIRELLEESPSLKPSLDGLVADVYRDARQQATAETGLPIATFPGTPSTRLKYGLDVELPGRFTL
jgi:hypothetical protein